MHCHKSFQMSAAWKEASYCNGWGQEGIPSVGCPSAVLRRPFLGRQAARRLQHLFLHSPAGFACLQLLSKASQEIGLGQVLSGNKKSWSMAVGLTNARLFTVSVGTLISLSHHRKLLVKRKSFAFRYPGRDQPFETQVTSIACFYFSKTELLWSVPGGTSGPVELLLRVLRGNVCFFFPQEERDS